MTGILPVLTFLSGLALGVLVPFAVKAGAAWLERRRFARWCAKHGTTPERLHTAQREALNRFIYGVATGHPPEPPAPFVRGERLH